MVIGVETGSPAGSEGTEVEPGLFGANVTFAISVAVGLGSKIDSGSKVEFGSGVNVGGFEVVVDTLVATGGVVVLVGGISVGFGVGGSDVGVG